MRELKIIYQDKNLVAVNKPAGLLVHPVRSRTPDGASATSNGVHPTATSAEKTLTDWLVKKYPEIKKVGDPSIRPSAVSSGPNGSGQAIQNRPGIVHRLDKDTSGIIVVARNQKYFEYLKKLFQEHKIKKTYLALVWGEIKNKTGIIEKPIFLKPGTTKRTVHKGKMEKPAVTEYEVLKFFHPYESAIHPHKSATFSYLKVIPKTGRTHQIRVHLASIGHPVVGDALYGPKKNPLGLERQFLHAESLEFNIEEGRKIKLEADLPKDLSNALIKLKNY